LKDIEKERGFSCKTVLRVLNDHTDISTTTKEIILILASKYSYTLGEIVEVFSSKGYERIKI
jgi:DNA-binding LacI/PurR family transcriptional regulator